jgi:tryptophanyl-tRNA synthetase
LKVPGLDGTGKMGKTAGNGIFLVDEPEVIRKKVMRAVTDAGPTSENQEMSEPIKNIFSLMDIVSTPDTVAHFRDAYNTCRIRYGDMKKQLAEDIIKATDPLREKIREILADDKYISKAAGMGQEKARANASKTLKEVREIIGFKPF